MRQSYLRQAPDRNNRVCVAQEPFRMHKRTGPPGGSPWRPCRVSSSKSGGIRGHQRNTCAFRCVGGAQELSKIFSSLLRVANEFRRRLTITMVAWDLVQTVAPATLGARSPYPRQSTLSQSCRINLARSSQRQDVVRKTGLDGRRTLNPRQCQRCPIESVPQRAKMACTRVRLHSIHSSYSTRFTKRPPTVAGQAPDGAGQRARKYRSACEPAMMCFWIPGFSLGRHFRSAKVGIAKTDVRQNLTYLARAKCDSPWFAPTYEADSRWSLFMEIVMPGHDRSKNGVAFARL